MKGKSTEEDLRKMGDEFIEHKKALIAEEMNNLEGKDLILTISLLERVIGFKIIAEGSGTNHKRFDFYVQILPQMFNFGVSITVPHVKPGTKQVSAVSAANLFMVTATVDEEFSPVRTAKKRKGKDTLYTDYPIVGSKYGSEVVPGFVPIHLSIEMYAPSGQEYISLLKCWYPNKRGPNAKKYTPDIDHPHDYVDPKACQVFSEILTHILEQTGYTVTTEIEIPDYYYPAPAQMGFAVPAFSTGLQKNIKPEQVTKADYPYDKTYTYLSHEKPNSKVQIQLNILDSIPEERLEKIERSLKENLSPYGLKCLYLVLEGCSQNQRTNYFIFDTNRALDIMGHGRDRRGIHYTRNKNRLQRSLDELTRINFNFETRIPAKGKKRKEEVTRFIAPLISTNGKFETWEVEEGKPVEEGTLIKDGIIIYFHPEIYKFIENRYTTIPHEFLKIDAGNKPNAILLYSYIANQWRIGWTQYHGVIKQPIRQILDGCGLLKRLPKRKNQQRTFIDKIKDDLKWLKSKRQFWIKRLAFQTRNKPHLDHMITIEMADNHPFKVSMKRQIKKE